MSLALGIPVRELQQRVTSAELAEWIAFEIVYGPIDPGRRIDVAAGVVASTLANLYRDPKKRAHPFAPDDFMPKWDRGPQSVERSSKDMLRMVELLNAAFGGQDLRSGDAR